MLLRNHVKVSEVCRSKGQRWWALGHRNRFLSLVRHLCGLVDDLPIELLVDLKLGFHGRKLTLVILRRVLELVHLHELR